MGNVLAATTGEDRLLQSGTKSQKIVLKGWGHSLSNQKNCKPRETRRFTYFLIAVEEQHDEVRENSNKLYPVVVVIFQSH